MPPVGPDYSAGAPNIQSLLLKDFPHLTEGDATLKARFRELFLAGPLRTTAIAASLLGLDGLA